MVDSINNIGPRGLVPVKSETERREAPSAEARVEELRQSSDTVEISDEARLAQVEDAARQAREQLSGSTAALSGGRIDTFA